MLAALLLNLGAAAPAPATPSRLGAPVWWLREQWRAEDEEELEELREECVELQEIVAEPIIYAPKIDPQAERKELRLQEALSRIPQVVERIEQLERLKQEVIEYEEFVVMMNILEI